jgi:AraC-like DNA-binding protein
MEKIEWNNASNTFLVSCMVQRSPDYMHSSHHHDAYELYYLRSGERKIFIKDRSYHLTKGCLVMIPPYEVHRTLEACVDEWERILVNFNITFLPDISGDLDTLLSLFRYDDKSLILNIKEQAQIENIFSRILHESDQQISAFQINISALLTELLVFIYRLKEQKASEISQSIQHIKIKPIIDYLNQNFADPLTLADIAGQFHMSPYYLCKVFKSSTEFTIIQYLHQIRIKRAQELLRETRRSILEISQLTGFISISHFNRIFRSTAGMTPSEYKKKFRYSLNRTRLAKIRSDSSSS